MRHRFTGVMVVCLASLAGDEPHPQRRHAPRYDDHARLMVVRDGTGREWPVRSTIDWQVRRAHILAHLQDVMGPLPGGERRVPLDVSVTAEFVEPKFVRRRITFAVEPDDRLPAWLLIPSDGQSKHPAALCLHQTTSIGKDEPAGLGGNGNLHYARELAERGYVTIVPDYVNFGEYRADAYALGYESASMKGIWNHKRAIDVLESMPEVDAERIGVIGHSLGGHNAIFVALFDERVAAIVSSCGFNAFPHYYGGNIAGWSHDGYMPRLRSTYGLDLANVPFDFPELVGALAPRALFVNAPLRDENFAVDGVRDCERAARLVYALYGATDRMAFEYPDAAHDFPAAVRTRAYEFLDRMLKRPAKIRTGARRAP